jgi:hypothetical protein
MKNKKNEKFIYDEIEKHGDQVVEITQYENYHFVKYYSRFNNEVEQYYCVFINGKCCNKVTKNKHAIMLIALAEEYDGINSQAATLVSKMLGVEYN